MVIVSPLLMSPTLVFQSSLPVLASTAQTWQSRVVMNTLPLSNTAPRLTVSQQATPLAKADGFGSYFHFTVPGLWRSSAYRMLGHGVTTYMTSFTTIGAASCPRWTPVSNVQATFRPLAFSVVMSARSLKRVLAKSLAAIGHWGPPPRGSFFWASADGGTSASNAPTTAMTMASARYVRREWGMRFSRKVDGRYGAALIRPGRARR